MKKRTNNLFGTKRSGRFHKHIRSMYMPFTDRFEIEDNQQLRIPQREGWVHIRDYFDGIGIDRFIGVVLPVGCGKSGLIAITPYALQANRVLVISPGTRIRDQLGEDMKSSSEQNFYEKCSVLDPNADFPETVVVASGIVNHDDIENADIVISNIQQIAGEENRWLDEFSPDFFDMILVDEGHHNTAASWRQVFDRFPNARVINFSATPSRADGQLMEGQVIYSFPVVRAIRAGYVKRLAAKMLRPSELTYVDRSTSEERTIGLQEVIELGQQNAEFRRGIVMSDETLSSIVDCTIGELRRLRQETGEQRLKIIASAINIDHCIQITEAFRTRGLRAAYVHSREGQNANQRVFQQLENHELDVIVQARMLGEGFDHKYLAVAMVGSIFANLSPFVQFVGRIMRVVEQNAPDSSVNRGVVVFHAGANVAQRWRDFRSFSDADQAYFADLLPEAENIDFGPDDVLDREPGQGVGGIQPIDIVSESGVSAEDLDPIGDPEVAALLQQLADRGITPDQAAAGIRRIRPTRQDQRRARRNALNERIQNESGMILRRCGINPGGRNLDPRHQNTNFQWAVAELNRRVNASASQEEANRENFTLDQLNVAHDSLDEHVTSLEAEIRDA
ncbi:DEAD/DEAH box helicase [Prosthecochloris sp. GSB1]|uniref:DEAD/DEAH box helicase n=1 Tax=Prosthecochloris sp. GSB1 TaxID=281093 RepID=UPI00142E44C3|nr:DEAD/DEAH box helicase family protein [Prosthecochloris sp. GSB1]